MRLKCWIDADNLSFFVAPQAINTNAYRYIQVQKLKARTNMNRLNEAERVSKLEEVIINLRNALFLFFCYAGLREIWLSKVLAPINGKAQIVFYVIMALLLIVGTASMPIEVKVRRSDTLYYQTHTKWMLFVAFALIGVFEVLAVLAL